MSLSRSTILFLLLVTAASLLSSSLTAQDSSPSMVWKVDNGTNTVYVAGLISILSAQDFPLPGSYQEAFDASNRLFDVNFRLRTDDYGMMDKLRKMGTYPHGVFLTKQLKPATLRKLDHFLKKSSLSPHAFDTVTPWCTSYALPRVLMDRHGFKVNPDVFSPFQELARKEHKEVRRLEDTFPYVQTMVDLAPQLQDDLLSCTLSELEAIEKDPGQAVRAWRKGDTAAFQRIFNQMEEGWPELYERLVLDRNRKWAQSVEGMFALEGPSLVLVDTRHLVGRDNLIDLLRRKGFSVRQM